MPRTPLSTTIAPCRPVAGRTTVASRHAVAPRRPITAYRALASTTLALIVTLAACGGAPQAQDYDVVIADGRVMDPASGLDAVRHVGIRDGRIAAVSEAALTGETVIDASGLVIAPGFIDLHAHGQDDENYGYYAADGVTSALELEVGTDDIDAWYAERDPGRRVNYGVSIGHIPVRMAVLDDPGDFLPSGDAAHREATDEELEEIERRIAQGLEQGAVGVGFGVAYTQAATRWEILEMFRTGARVPGAAAFVHMRGGIAGLEEAIAASAVTGLPLHIVHINSSGGSRTPRMLRIIGEARERGLDVTTESYPYTAGMTRIESALYDGWEDWPDERFDRYEWPATGERLTRALFARYREQGGFIVSHSNTEEMVTAAVTSPLTMIASDGLIEDRKGHPRTSGTYAKVLGRYTRERGELELMGALRKMTIMPAERLAPRVPEMRRKGRIEVDADADIVVFDPETVIDRSTYAEPALTPDGIEHVLVGGEPVVSDGELVDGARPGRAIRAPRGTT